MNPVMVIIAGGGAYLLWKGAKLESPPPVGGAAGQTPINPAGAGGTVVDNMSDGPLNSTETGGSNGAPPAPTCPTCAPADAGLSPAPPPSSPTPTAPSGSTSGIAAGEPAPTKTTTTTTTSSTGGAYSTTTTKQAYIDYKISGYNGYA